MDKVGGGFFAVWLGYLFRCIHTDRQTMRPWLLKESVPKWVGRKSGLTYLG